MSLRLIECFGSTEELAELFSDRSVIESMLAFEAGLARAQARVGLIPQRAADAICSAASADGFDAAKLAGEARESATLTAPLVRTLTERVRENR